MDPSPPNSPPIRRWPLRAGLSLALMALVAVGVRESTASIAAAPTTTIHSISPTTSTTSSSVVQSTTPTTSMPRTPTTTSPVSNFPQAQAPVSTYLNLEEPKSGCGFALTLPTPATSPGGSATAPIRAVGHCRVLEIGDSIGSDLGWGLQRELGANASLHLFELDRSSTGLAASWYFNWPAHLRKYLAQYRPDLTIICLGGNDQQALAVNGVSQPFGSPTWRDAYSARVRQVASMITAAHSYVLWVGLPIMEPPQYSRGANALNTVYRHEATVVPGMTFLPSWSIFANGTGQYQNAAFVNGQAQVLRSSDGIHFSYVGENVFATFVAEELATIYHVRVTPQAPAYLRR